MRLTLVALLTLLTACSTSTKMSARSASDDVTTDASWTPPEEVQLSVHETGPAPKAAEAPAFAAPKPNKRETPKHALHAATY